MKELSKFYRIYCHENHKYCADLLPQIEQWLDKPVGSSTGYAPVELIFNAQRLNNLRKVFAGIRGFTRKQRFGS